MDIARIAESGASDVKRKLTAPVTRAVAARTRFDERTLRALVGGLFLLAALRTVVRVSRAAVREARA